VARVGVEIEADVARNPMTAIPRCFAVAMRAAGAGEGAGRGFSEG